MMRLALALLVISSTLVGARTWTDVQGRKLEGEMVRVDGGNPVVKVNGKELSLPLDKLSAEDQSFVADWLKAEADRAAEAKAKEEEAAKRVAAGEFSLDGTPLEKNGKTTIIERPYPENMQPKNKEETNLKLGIVLPPNFDPSKPMRVFVVTTAQNSAAETLSGNVGKLRMYAKACAAAGWVCVAFDSNTGVSTATSPYYFGMQLLLKEFPNLKTAEYAVGGFSGGAKACSIPLAYLVKQELNVVGAFLGGCNRDYFEEDRKNFGAPRGPYGKVKAFLSAGETDKTASVAASEAVEKNLKSSGVGETYLAIHPDGHKFNEAHFAQALAWFAGGELPKKEDAKDKK